MAGIGVPTQTPSDNAWFEAVIKRTDKPGVSHLGLALGTDFNDADVDKLTDWMEKCMALMMSTLDEEKALLESTLDEEKGR